jgi:sortase A
MRKWLTQRGNQRKLALGTLTVALGCFAQALWIHAKAELAQVLIESAWERTLAQSARAEPAQAQKPWSWADTWPVARLQWSEGGATEDLYVLAGATGNSLAFGPGHLSDTAPVGAGASVLAGHRDTHFAFLRELQAGSELELQTAAGERFVYYVADMQVKDSSTEPLLIDPTSESLTLITCYPFDAPLPGGPLRYVVTALRQEL